MALDFSQAQVENSMQPILHHLIGINLQELMVCLGLQAIFMSVATCMGVSLRLDHPTTRQKVHVALLNTFYLALISTNSFLIGYCFSEPSQQYFNQIQSVFFEQGKKFCYSLHTFHLRVYLIQILFFDYKVFLCC